MIPAANSAPRLSAGTGRVSLGVRLSPISWSASGSESRERLAKYINDRLTLIENQLQKTSRPLGEDLSVLNSGSNIQLKDPALMRAIYLYLLKQHPSHYDGFLEECLHLLHQHGESTTRERVDSSLARVYKQVFKFIANYSDSATAARRSLHASIRSREIKARLNELKRIMDQAVMINVSEPGEHGMSLPELRHPDHYQKIYDFLRLRPMRDIRRRTRVRISIMDDLVRTALIVAASASPGIVAGSLPILVAGLLAALALSAGSKYYDVAITKHAD